jgi:hypothetical protein
MTGAVGRFSSAWERRAGRPFGLDLAAFSFAMVGIGLSVAGFGLLVQPEGRFGATIGSDHYELTGVLTGILLAVVGVVTLVGFVAAYRVGSYGLILGLAISHVLLAAYGFATTGQAGSMVITLLVLAAVWSARRTASTWWA